MNFDIRETLKNIGKHKQEIIVGGAVLIGNTAFGLIYSNQANRLSNMEQELAGMKQRAVSHEWVMGNLMEEDVRTTDAVCRQASIIGALSGLPAPDSEECDSNTEQQIEYWRRVIAEASK